MDRGHRRRERVAGRAAHDFRPTCAFHAFVVVVVVVVFWRCGGSPMRRSGARCRRCATTNSARRSLGYDVYRLRLYALTLTAGVVGLAGALLTFMLQGVYADNLSWQHAGDSLLMTVLGGVHHFLGPLWGAIAFIVLQDRLSSIRLWNIGENWWLIFAPILMVFALFSPEGVQGLVQRAAQARALDPDAQHDPAAPRVRSALTKPSARMDPNAPYSKRANCRRASAR